MNTPATRSSKIISIGQCCLGSLQQLIASPFSSTSSCILLWATVSTSQGLSIFMVPLSGCQASLLGIMVIPQQISFTTLAGSFDWQLEDYHHWENSQEAPKGFALKSTHHCPLDTTYRLPPLMFAFIVKALPIPRLLLNKLEFEKCDSAQELQAQTNESQLPSLHSGLSCSCGLK